MDQSDLATFVDVAFQHLECLPPENIHGLYFANGTNEQQLAHNAPSQQICLANILPFAHPTTFCASLVDAVPVFRVFSIPCRPVLSGEAYAQQLLAWQTGTFRQQTSIPTTTADYFSHHPTVNRRPGRRSRPTDVATCSLSLPPYYSSWVVSCCMCSATGFSWV
jgi:hypothetical protein